MLHGSRANLLQKFITEMLCNYSTSHLRRFMNGTVNFNALQLIKADFTKCFTVKQPLDVKMSDIRNCSTFSRFIW